MRNLFLALTALLAFPVVGSAATIEVDSTADTLVAGDGQCTLREAILNANYDTDTTAGDCAAGDGADVIELPTGRYVLTIAGEYEDDGSLTGDLDVAADLTLRGVGAALTVIDAAGFTHAIQFLDPVEVARVDQLAITGAQYQGIASAAASLIISESELFANGGAGVAAWSRNVPGAGTQPVAMTLSRSVVTRNDGGGISSAYGANLVRIENSTISGQTVDLLCSIGYACERGSGLDGRGHFEVSNSTIANNGGTVNGGGANPAIGPYLSVTFRGSVISNPMNCFPWLANYVPVHSAGYNVFFSAANEDCGDFVSSDRLGADPLLGSLQDNGGPTWTHALLAGSPARDAIPAAECSVATDQRGVARPQWIGCDIGAFEAVAAGCGLGPDLAVLLPALLWLRERRRRGAA